MALTLNGTTGLSGIAGSAGTPALQGNNDANTGYFFATDTLGLSTAGTERLRIDSNGNVSIHSGAYDGGNTVPQLYVRGTSGRQVKIHNPNAGTCSLQLSNATTGQGEDNGFQLAQLSGGDFYFDHQLQAKDIVFRTKPSGGSIDERLRIKSNGQIGINMAPSADAQVCIKNSDDSNYNVFDCYNDNGNKLGGFSQDSTGNGSMGIRTNAGDLNTFFRSSGISYLNGGNVGIGTTSPTRNLHLHSTSANTQVLMQVSNATTGSASGDGFHIGINSSQEVLLQNKENTKMTLLTNDNARITIANDGHVVLSNSIAFRNETSADNRLDDYEEGVHTQAPVNANLTLTNNILRYTKIGRLVTVSGMLKPSAVSASNTVAITLPFTSLADSGTTCGRYTSALMHKFVNIDDSYKNVVGYVGQNEAYWRIYHVGDNLDWHQLTNNDLSTDTEIFFTFTYHTTD